MKLSLIVKILKLLDDLSGIGKMPDCPPVSFRFSHSLCIECTPDLFWPQVGRSPLGERAMEDRWYFQPSAEEVMAPKHK